MFTKDQLFKELEALSDPEYESLLRVVKAWKNAKVGSTSFIEQLLNIEYMGFDPEKNVHRHKMLITDELKNRIQTLHGGVTAAFVDTAMGLSLLRELGPQISIVTLDLSIRYLTPGLKGWIIGEIEIVKKGRTIVTLDARIRDEQEKIIATASGTFFRIE